MQRVHGASQLDMREGASDLTALDADEGVPDLPSGDNALTPQPCEVTARSTAPMRDWPRVSFVASMKGMFAVGIFVEDGFPSCDFGTLNMLNQTGHLKLQGDEN